MREHLDGFAAEDDCRNTAATVRGQYIEVTAFRFCGINNGLVMMFVISLNDLTRNPRPSYRLSDSAE